MKYSTDIVVVDLEATCRTFGANEVTESNILEIGAVRLDRRTLRVMDQFSELVQPRDYPILPQIVEVTGIKPDMVESCDQFDAVGRRFIEWYGKRNRSILAAWSVYYDIPLLRKEFAAFGLDFNESFVGAALDIRAIAMAWLANNNQNTTGVTIEKTLVKMGIALDLQWHRAVDDAKGAAAILRHFHILELPM
jgi:inhibitor of KinA sporulation pathway (predicted exonuclease)